ncbi:MAG: MBL fold metallo-hydrolase [Bacteroidetes bacterium]|nr:MBL fold metallo-hydrolase [Bacteroidota bacterium]
MRIEYVCHSCLYIDTGDTQLVIDPWFKGSAYLNQWHLFPKPVNTKMLSDVKHIFYSHGHEDHLHSESLEELPNSAKVFFPYQWRKGIRNFFHERNFSNVTEAESFKAYQISPTTKITYIGFGLESLIVIEIKDTVIVNINDALNSHHQNVTAMFLREIKKRWPKIHYLFSGWAGAGYFPNAVHYKTKNDVEIAKIREQYFGNNFAKFIHYLQPDVAIPFAPGFVLLSPDKLWINDVKFPRTYLEQYYRENFDANTSVKFYIPNPGDYFDEDGFHNDSPYYALEKNGSLNHLIPEIYSDEMKKAEKIIYINEDKADLLVEKISECLEHTKNLYDKIVLEDVDFSIRLDDLLENNYFNVRFEKNKFKVYRSAEPQGTKLLIRTKYYLLKHSLENLWGGDVLTIGYGIDVDVFEEDVLEKNIDIVCVRLLARYPTTLESLRKDPFRALNYFAKHPMMSALAMKQKLMLKSAVNKFPYNERDHWISYSKCDLCQVCNMPLLSFEFGEKLGALAV